MINQHDFVITFCAHSSSLTEVYNLDILVGMPTVPDNSGVSRFGPQQSPDFMVLWKNQSKLLSKVLQLSSPQMYLPHLNRAQLHTENADPKIFFHLLSSAVGISTGKQEHSFSLQSTLALIKLLLSDYITLEYSLFLL